jgi:undecaprenyl phosphate N,N'-diacetylbacillosamine 1-phosphate transferase
VYKTVIKPGLDWMVALIVLIVASPILIVIALLLALTNGGRVWFVQQRPGYMERPFYMVKFRTMRDAFDSNGLPLPDAQRLRGFGKLVRATSLDELPQLINVLKGDMSLVGPRPLLMEYLPLYNKEQRTRHNVRPGITGWAQVNGRNAISWSEKFAFDTWYVNHLSFRLDVKILLLTLLKVFKAEGISSKTSVTMEKFRGNG